MSNTGIGLLQKLNHKAVVSLSGTEYTVEILLNGTAYLRGPAESVSEVHLITDDSNVNTGIYGVRSWKTNVPVLNKEQHPVRFILMGNLMEEITDSDA